MPLLLPQRQAVLVLRLEVVAEQALVAAAQQSVGRREREHRVRRRPLYRIRKSWDSRQPESRCFWPAQNSIPE